MTKSPRLRLTALSIGLLVAALPGVVSASHSWGGYHWARTTQQFTLKLGNNLTTTDWRGHLATSSSNWNSPGKYNAGSTPLLTAIVAGTSNKRCSMVAGTTQVCNGRYGNNGWLGLASINITGGTHITQGSAKMNDTYFDTSTYNNTNEREHVMCQEIAHTFGLGHQSETAISLNTCMDYFSNTGANATNKASTEPNKHDFDQLNIIYGHPDSTTTVAKLAALAASPSGVSNDPNSWGMMTRQSANGRSSIYERYEANGSKTITHVYWTNETAATCPSCDHRFTH